MAMMSVLTQSPFESYNSTYFANVGASSITKLGRTVELNISMTPTTILPTNTTILTLPIGYRPAYGGVKYFVARSLNDALTTRLLQVDSSGAIKFVDNNGSVPVGAVLDGYVSFITTQ